MTLQTLDLHLIHFFRKISVPAARIALFVVFFWFGFLKVIDKSPASGVMENLSTVTIPYVNFGAFLIAFGVFECVIGILFLIKGAERVVIPLLFIHMITTFGPLVLLPSETWQSFMVPTLEGQYIIKNLVIIAAAIAVAAHLHPMKRWHRHS